MSLEQGGQPGLVDRVDAAQIHDDLPGRRLKGSPDRLVEVAHCRLDELTGDPDDVVDLQGHGLAACPSLTDVFDPSPRCQVGSLSETASPDSVCGGMRAEATRR